MKIKIIHTILLAVFVGIILFFGFLFIRTQLNLEETNVNQTAQDGEYQAVFLVNTQVYFGKLSHLNSKYPVLTDVYYLQISEDLSQLQAEDVSNVRLIKLGGELHGPTDEMKINRDHIILIEDLRADSNIVEAIKQYQDQRSR